VSDQYSVLFHLFARGVTAMPRGLRARLCHTFLVVKIICFVEPSRIFQDWANQNFTVVPVGIFMSRIIFSQTCQSRCKPQLSNHSIAFARWRQQHRTGDSHWDASHHFSLSRVAQMTRNSNACGFVPIRGSSGGSPRGPFTGEILLVIRSSMQFLT